MKVAIVGNGNVGMATFQGIFTMREVHEIVLVGRNVEKIKAEINDYKDCQALRTDCKCRISGGDYSLTQGADIIVYTAGAPRKEGQSRLDLLKANVEVAKSIFAEINKYNKDAIVIVVSNPVDVLTTLIQKFTERPECRVIGTGTLLDSARLRRMVADFLDVSTDSVVFNVVGEHGNSSCLLWSSVNVAGMNIYDFLKLSDSDSIVVNKDKLHEMVTKAGGKLIKDKGSTSYGVAAAVYRIVSAIINDTRELLTVSTVLNGEYDVDGIAISVPCVVGREGAEIMRSYMSKEEKTEFDNSVRILKEAYLGVCSE